MPTKPRKPAGKRTSARKPKTYTKRKRPVTRRPQKASINIFKNYVSNDPFPPRRNYKLTFSQTYLFPVGAGGVFGQENIYRLNSLFDPDETGVGHQPYGFDQVATLYKRYKVNGCLVEVTWNDPNQDGIAVGMMMTPPSSVTTLAGLGFDAANEKPFTTTRSINNSGSQKIYMKTYIPISKACGITKAQFSNDLDSYTALVGTNPALSPRIRLACCSPAAGVGGNVQAQIKMTFYCSFWDRIVLAQS